MTSKSNARPGPENSSPCYQVAEELGRRLSRLFLKGADGQRPVLKYHPKLAGDPHFRDYVLFHEYFQGDTGRGVRGVSSDGLDRARLPNCCNRTSVS